MQEKRDGATYAPKGKKHAVCESGEYKVGVIGLDHGHIYGMCNGLSEAGADIALVYDSDAERVKAFIDEFPTAKAAASREEVLSSNVRMIASAAIPCERGNIGIETLKAGKDFFSDKPSVTSFEQLNELRRMTKLTGHRFFTYFSERLHSESSVCAEQLIKEGRIGKVVQVMSWGPHRIGTNRPDWFFEPVQNGGIITDIGCHQIEELVFFAGADDAKIVTSRVGNYNNRENPRFQDFGDAMLQFPNGVTGYFRVDWFTPDGLSAWGDGRLLIIGTEGYMEVRKYIDVAASSEGDHIYLVDKDGEHHICAGGKYGFPFFGKMIRDCLDGTENAMKQDYVLRIMELALEAQTNAQWVEYAV